MCQATIRITSRSLDGVTNAKLLLDIKDAIALFIQTMEVSFPLCKYASHPLTTPSGLGLFRLHP
jgi:hypothetical protein